MYLKPAWMTDNGPLFFVKSKYTVHDKLTLLFTDFCLNV